MLSGKLTEGIFRVSADVDEVSYLKSRLDHWDVPEHKSTMGKFFFGFMTIKYLNMIKRVEVYCFHFY